MSKSKKEEPTIVPFELKVGGVDGIDNADVPVRWCITPDFVTRMEEDNIQDPHILLVSVNGKDEMSRHLVPVADLMTYVRFTKAGKMKLHGWIVDGACGRTELHKDFLYKSRGEYRTDVIDKYRGGTPEEDIKHTYIGTTTEVVIPKDVFGKEPSGWVKWFANLWHEDRTQDECHFRRRVILAFTIKWIAVLFVGLLTVTYRAGLNTLLTLSGFRHNPRWKYVWRPYKYTNGMAVETSGEDGFDLHYSGWYKSNNFIWVRTTKDGIEIGHLAMLAFIPSFVLLLFGLTFLLSGYLGMAFLVAGNVVGIVFAVLLCVDILMEIIYTLPDEVGTKTTKWLGIIDSFILSNKFQSLLIMIIAILGLIVTVMFFKNPEMFWFMVKVVVPIFILTLFTMFGVMWAINKFEGIKDYDPSLNDVSNMRELLCPKDSSNLHADYDFIPKENRTARLWVKKMKNSICRPMQF